MAAGKRVVSDLDQSCEDTERHTAQRAGKKGRGEIWKYVYTIQEVLVLMHELTFSLGGGGGGGGD